MNRFDWYLSETLISLCTDVIGLPPEIQEARMTEGVVLIP